MQKQPNILIPTSSEAYHTSLSSTRNSQFSMTSEQRKLYQSGLYFPEKILFSANIDIRISEQKQKQEWQSDFPMRITSQAFGYIPITSICKIKYYATNSPDKYKLKVETISERLFFQVQKREMEKMFSTIAWSKLATLNMFSNIEDYDYSGIQGQIYKKSQVLAKWQKRHVRITTQRGLQSFKNLNSPPTVSIKQISDLWTRFETIKETRYVVIKFWVGIIKNEFGIPTDNSYKWLQAFCSLLSQKQQKK